MNQRLSDALQAILQGDAGALPRLLRSLQGDPRLPQVRQLVSGAVQKLARDLGEVFAEHGPQAEYPAWRTAIGPAMAQAAQLSEHRLSQARRRETQPLLQRFAEVLYRLGCCRILWRGLEDDAGWVHWFVYERHCWICDLPKKLGRERECRLEKGLVHHGLELVPLTPRLLARAKALLTYVIGQADDFLAAKAAKPKPRRPAGLGVPISRLFPPSEN